MQRRAPTEIHSWRPMQPWRLVPTSNWFVRWTAIHTLMYIYMCITLRLGGYAPAPAAYACRQGGGVCRTRLGPFFFFPHGMAAGVYAGMNQQATTQTRTTKPEYGSHRVTSYTMLRLNQTPADLRTPHTTNSSASTALASTFARPGPAQSRPRSGHHARHTDGWARADVFG